MEHSIVGRTSVSTGLRIARAPQLASVVQQVRAHRDALQALHVTHIVIEVEPNKFFSLFELSEIEHS